MTDRHLIFNGPMVRALLDGTKTQTRRIIGFPGVEKVVDFVCVGTEKATGARVFEMKDAGGNHVSRPVGKCLRDPQWKAPFVVGDRIWVRENWALHGRYSDIGRVVYMATKDRSWTEAHEDIPIALVPKSIKARPFQDGFKPSIHMPRAFSRLTMIVSGVKVERLQDISEADARAEGVLFVPGHGDITPAELSADPGFSNYLDCRLGFEALWDSINGKPRKRKDLPSIDYSWKTNPWVVAVTFSVHRSNIDNMPQAEAA